MPDDVRSRSTADHPVVRLLRELAAPDYPAALAVSAVMGILRPWLIATTSIAALSVRPRIELTRDVVEVKLPPDELIEVVRERLAASPDDILAMEPDRLVRRFAGTEGPFRFNTVEVVRYEEHAITFEHLSGPFSECSERFDLAATPTGTLLTHSGSFRLRGGLLTAALAIGPVKKACEAHVRGHFQTLAAEFASS